MFRWDYGSINEPVELGPILDPSSIGYRWDGLAYDNHTDTLYSVLAFPPFGAPPTARGLYTLDPVTLQAVQVLPWSGVSISALAYNSADRTLYALDDVGLQIVRVDPVLGTITPVPGSAYPMGIVDLDGCAAGGNRVYMVDDDDMGEVLVFNLTTGMYESSASFTAPFASGACAAAWMPNNAQGTTATYCTPANLNSTGAPAVMEARGSNYALDNEMTLVASSLPTGAFGFFLTSQTSGFSANPGGSQGNLCISGAIGRYVGPGEIKNTGLSGEFSLGLDLLQVPTPTGPVAVMPGETWYYQGWFRDAVGGMATSNLTDGVSVMYL